MGKMSKGRGKFRERTLRRQIILSFHSILGLSLLATLLTVGLMLFIFWQIIPSVLRPANYYEQQIPSLVMEIREHVEQVVTPSGREWMESVIPLEGIQYEVLDARGQTLYGNMRKSYFADQQDFFEKLNTQLYDKDYYVKYYALADRSGAFVGAVGLSYTLSFVHANPEGRLYIAAGTIVVLASPFIYFYMFSWLVGRRFSRRIEHPFNQLVEGARKIQQHDLDFHLPLVQHSKELNRLVQAFEEMRAALKQSLNRQWGMEQERKDMIATIAHDLRTPLTIILGHVEGLLDGGLKHPERLERYLQTIYDSTQRSIRLLEQMSRVSAIERADFVLQPEPVSVKQFIERKSKEYEWLCGQKRIRFVSLIEHGEEADEAKTEMGSADVTDRNETAADEWVYIDVDRMSQVLDNLVTNSLRYTPEGGEIAWITRCLPHAVQFIIQDSGPGIEPSTREDIFNKFYRGDPSRKGEGGHAGLGLYIVNLLVGKHGGTIQVDKSELGGALFIITLPRKLPS